jgi:hypothetical protein
LPAQLQGAFQHIDIHIGGLATAKKVYNPLPKFLGGACVKDDPEGCVIKVHDAPAHYPKYPSDYYAVCFENPDDIKLKLVHAPGWVWPVSIGSVTANF